MPAPVSPDSPLAVTDDEKEELRESKPGESLSVITLKGIAQTEDGEVVKYHGKSKYLNLLSGTLDDYSDIQFTPEERRTFDQQITHLTHGSCATVPVLCQGHLCPWAARCPLQQIGKAPVGRQCLIELNIIKNAQFRYLNEYDVDTENYTEWTMISQLAEIEVMLWRINQYLANDPELATGVQEQTVGFDNQGNEITRKEISTFMDLQDRLYTRKAKLTKMLVGDRQEKYKREAALKKREEGDTSSTMANLREQMENVQRRLAKAARELPIEGHVEVVENVEEIETAEDQIRAEQSVLNPDDITVD